MSNIKADSRSVHQLIAAVGPFMQLFLISNSKSACSESLKLLAIEGFSINLAILSALS